MKTIAGILICCALVLAQAPMPSPVAANTPTGGSVGGASSIPATGQLITTSSGTAGGIKVETLKLIYGYLYPSADGTQSVQIRKADGTTPVVITDTTNGAVNILGTGTLGSESLAEGNFTTTTKWTAAGDFSFAGGKAVFTKSSGSGTITQNSGDMSVEGVSNQWYKLVYTLSGATPGDLACYVTTSFASATTTFTLATGGISYFKAASSPGNFVIGCSGTSGIVSIDDLSLKEVQAGDLLLGGNLNARTVSTGTLTSSQSTIQGMSYPVVTITQGGTPATTAYTYVVVGTDAAGKTRAMTGSTATGAAVLSGTDYNRVTVAVWLASSPYVLPVGACDVYKTVPVTGNKKIGTIASCAAGGYLDDVGQTPTAGIPPADTSGMLALAGTVPADNVTYTATGTGSVARSQASKNADVVSVLDFIPVAEHAAIRAGTSTTDVTTYIQAALTAQADKSLYIPYGTYRVSNLTVAQNTSVWADSPRTTRFVAVAGSTGVMVIDNGNASGIMLHGFTLDGNGENYTKILSLGNVSTVTGTLGNISDMFMRTTATTGICLDINGNEWWGDRVTTLGCATGALLNGTYVDITHLSVTNTTTVAIDVVAGNNSLTEPEVEAPANGSLIYRIANGPIKLTSPKCSLGVSRTITDCINLTSVSDGNVVITGINVLLGAGSTLTNQLSIGATPVLTYASPVHSYF